MNSAPINTLIRMDFTENLTPVDWLKYLSTALCVIAVTVNLLRFLFKKKSLAQIPYDTLKDRATAQMKQLNQQKQKVILSEGHVGTLYRPRQQKGARLDLSDFNGIISFDQANKTVDVGGRTSFLKLTSWLLRYNLAPFVVPELSTITVGGALVGVGIESSSFRHGFPHETVEEFDLLLSSGAVVTCRRDNAWKKLFYGAVNSYGTLGYILRVRLRLRETKPYVRVTNRKFTDMSAFSYYMETTSKKEQFDFIDGVIFSDKEAYVMTGTFSEYDSKVSVRSYPRNGVYYKSIRQHREEQFTAEDYYWRWDADSFWGTEGTFLQNSWFRWLTGRRFLNGEFLKKNRGSPNKYLKKNKECIIQDIGIPENSLLDYLQWLNKKVNLFPIWVCPVMPQEAEKSVTWNLKDGKMYFDVAIFGRKDFHSSGNPIFYNRSIELKTEMLGGLKTFYSDSFYPRADWDRIFNGAAYDQLKNEVDPKGLFPHLFDKCVAPCHQMIRDYLKEKGDHRTVEQMIKMPEMMMVWPEKSNGEDNDAADADTIDETVDDLAALVPETGTVTKKPLLVDPESEDSPAPETVDDATTPKSETQQTTTTDTTSDASSGSDVAETTSA